jgi:hypothetical protein
MEAGRPVNTATGAHDHARPDIRVQRAVLSIARSLLGDDREAAAVATLKVPCVPCLVLAATWFGLAAAAQLAGETAITPELRARLLALIAEAERELREGGN